jgi:hypothetical protein
LFGVNVLRAKLVLVLGLFLGQARLVLYIVCVYKYTG